MSDDQNQTQPQNINQQPTEQVTSVKPVAPDPDQFPADYIFLKAHNKGLDTGERRSD